MDYTRLILRIALLAIFTWLLIRNSKRSGFIHMLFRFDTIVGMVAGLYLIISSVHTLLVQ